MSSILWINFHYNPKVNWLMALLNNIQIMLAKKELRDAKRYKQIDIARESGLSQPIISKLMNSSDISHFTLETAHLLAAWLGCAIEDLYKKPEQHE
jgi:transcriptional regulator with XRE-family HTH domain